MGRYRVIALLVIALATCAHAASEDFALQEWDRYVKRMNTAATLQVQIDPALNEGKESYSIKITESGYTVLGSNENMALTGVYHLLDNAGCRFLAPSFDHYRGAAEYVPPKMGPVLFAGSMTWSPQLKFRKLYVEEGHSHDIENLKQLVEWMPKVGYNTLVIPTNYGGSDRVKWDNWRVELTPELQKRGITIEVGGHGYENFINAKMNDGRLFEEHPEWFGVDEKGERSKA